MSDAAVSPAVNEDEAVLAMPFVRCLVRLIRAQDASGSREGKSDAELLGDFIITRKQRRAIPIIGDPDPDVLWRLDMFYTAVGVRIEERSGLMTSPTMEMKPMGASDDCFHGRAVGRSVETFIGLASRRSGNSRTPVRN